jgi:hypothetical protein
VNSLIQRLQDATEGSRTCENCTFGDHFSARSDEMERYGADVMGCKRPNWDGYTRRASTCEAFAALSAKDTL